MDKEISDAFPLKIEDVSAKIKNLGVKTDFNLVTENTIFKAHKTIFGAYSNFLLELFLV